MSASQSRRFKMVYQKAQFSLGASKLFKRGVSKSEFRSRRVEVGVSKWALYSGSFNVAFSMWPFWKDVFIVGASKSALQSRRFKVRVSKSAFRNRQKWLLKMGVSNGAFQTGRLKVAFSRWPSEIGRFKWRLEVGASTSKFQSTMYVFQPRRFKREVLR